jgi:hypothetical protein
MAILGPSGLDHDDVSAIVANFDFSFGATSIFPSVVTSIFEVTTNKEKYPEPEAKIEVFIGYDHSFWESLFLEVTTSM